MKIITYNINGIRSALKSGLLQWLKVANPDIIAFQEVKCTESQFEIDAFSSLGYHSYVFSAQKPGYSGVAILSKQPANKVKTGFNTKETDNEGRVILIEFNTFNVVSAYFPSGASGEERHFFKQQFLHNFYQYAKDFTKPTIVMGDFNICHQAIDIYDPISFLPNSGFLKEERDWLTYFLELGYIDAFRFCNPQPHQYTWFSYMAGAKKRNLGWRIDYILVPKSMTNKIKHCSILSSANFSDHVPVLLHLDLQSY